MKYTEACWYVEPTPPSDVHAVVGLARIHHLDLINLTQNHEILLKGKPL